MLGAEGMEIEASRATLQPFEDLNEEREVNRRHIIRIEVLTVFFR